MLLTVNQSRKSPNHASRSGHPIRVVILHATVGTLKSSLDWLCSPAARVSSHYVISKTGVIYQLVAETEAAWHAGDANWHGETAVNEISIGVELANSTGMKGFKGQDPYPAVQVQALTDLARNLMRRFPGIAFARHLDVALPKGRKTDPAGFPWREWRAQLAPAPPVPHPPANPARYRVRPVLISQRSEGGAPYAGELQPGEVVEIDIVYANNMCHLKDERGFVPIAALMPWGDGAIVGEAL